MNLTPEQLIEIMPNCPRASVADYARMLADAMVEGEITTVTRAAAFLGQLAHESGDLRWMIEQADGSAYEGRHDLGNVQSGDGPRYKGRGPLQLTGRANYRRVGAALGLPLEAQPEMAAQPNVGFRVAVNYWTDHMLNHAADRLDYVGVTRAINGGLNGHSLRSEKIVLALGVLGRNAIVVGG
jgi:predicted chitinase